VIQKRSIFNLGLINAFASVLGILFSVVLAQSFGVSREVEIYFASSSLFFLINSLTQTGQMAEITLPIYHQLIEDYGRKEAGKAFSVIINYVAVIGIFVSILALLLAQPVMQYYVKGFSDEDKLRTIYYFSLITPLLFFEILKGQLVTLLNAEKIFGKIEIGGLFSQLFSLTFIWLFHQSLGIFAAMVGLWVGELTSFAVAIYFLKKIKFNYTFHFLDDRIHLKSLLRKLGSTYLYVLATQSYSFVFNAGLTLLPQGAYAVFKYAVFIYSKTQSLINRPILVVFYTQFSKLFVQKSEQFKELVLQTNRLTLLISTLWVTVLFAGGEYGMRFLWVNEKFSLEDLNTTFYTLCILFLLVLFNGIGQVYRKIAVAINEVNTLYTMNSLNQLFTALLSYLLLPWIGFWGALGIQCFNIFMLSLIPILVVLYSGRGVGFYVQWHYALKIVLYLIFTGVIFGALHLFIPQTDANLPNLIYGASLAAMGLLTFYVGAKVMGWVEIKELQDKLMVKLLARK
jgi:putative peptidoglycan lipid II flippase